MFFFKNSDGTWKDKEYDPSWWDKLVKMTDFSLQETYAGRTQFEVLRGVANEGKDIDISVKYVGKTSQNDLFNNALYSMTTTLEDWINTSIKYFSAWIEAALEKADLKDTQPAWLAIRNIAFTLISIAVIVMAFANVMGGTGGLEQYGAHV